MSWSQDYSVPSYMELLISLTGKRPEELLEAELAKQGLSVSKKETIILDEGMFADIKGEKVTLSDGRVFEPKLIERFTENGNYGLDTYQYALEEETPNVSYTGFDRAADDTEETVIATVSPDCGNCDGCEQGFGCEYPNE